MKEKVFEASDNAGGFLPSQAPRAVVSRSERLPWAGIIALAMGMFIFGLAEGYGPFTALGNVIPSRYGYLALGLPYIAGGIGALISGYLADAIGRRNTFILVVVMILTGMGIYIALPNNAVGIIASFTLVGLAGIGLETPVLAALSEIVPARLRGSVLVIVQDFGNLSGVIFFPLALGFSSLLSEVSVVLLFLVPLATLLIGYLAVEETKPWTATAHRSDKEVEEAWRSIDGGAEAVNPSAPLWFRFLIVTVIGLVQDLGFLYIAFDAPYEYFPSIAPEIPLWGGLLSGLFGIAYGLYLVKRMQRRALSVLSYGLLAATWAAVWAYVQFGGASLNVVLIMMVFAFIPLEMTWGVRAMLEPELFPTKLRGRYIASVRAIVWIASAIASMAFSYWILPFPYEAALVMGILLAGLLASIAWQTRGFETAGKSLLGHDVQGRRKKGEYSTRTCIEIFLLTAIFDICKQRRNRLIVKIRP